MGRKSREKRNRPPIETTPSPWYYAPLFGAAVLFVFVGLGALFRFLTTDPSPNQEHELLVVPFIAAIAGGAGGLAYSFITPPLLRIPSIGKYLAGIAMLTVYLLAACTAIWFAMPDSMERFRTNPVVAVISFVIVAVGFGLYIGRDFFDEVSPEEMRRWANRKPWWGRYKRS